MYISNVPLVTNVNLPIRGALGPNLTRLFNSVNHMCIIALQVS